ncbi:aldehyde dehydrogenase family protein [Nocardiopsis dassonvillei]|uniref:aldehyde dehydrogenase family protein n=1 Tax=Nocardiopsis dassonvillei TaxID=2014 RepID=UPI0020102802|nr:aldehyde dehydrogenase family protein [Nocardiopsis dassonvillei]MCK9873767.1 aldehyde dehydrogenase family protein [Nocardiopsis dassonvillei]
MAGGITDTRCWEGRVFVAGAWSPAHGGRAEAREPATGHRLAETAAANATDVAAAVTAAEHAQPNWSATPATERARVLYRAARLLEDHSDDVLWWLVREGGGTRAKATHEIGSTMDELLTAASLATRPYGHLLPSAEGEHSYARRIPLGVVGVISPWNVPLLLGARAIAPALALGNAVVLKPDPRTAVSGGYIMARLFEEAGLPGGVLNVVPGAAEAGESLVRSPGTAMIAFTGSTRVGRRIGGIAGERLTRVSLELGGNNPYIILSDADVEAAADAGAWGSFHHQGQICMAVGRHIVVESVAKRYIAALTKRAEALRVGDPWRDDPDLGPLIDDVQLRRVHRLVASAVSAGAVLHTGGTHEGPFYRPTVLSEVPQETELYQEETFGPVAAVVTVPDEDAAVEVANDTGYGLSAAVRTRSVEHGRAFADRLHTATVHVNGQTIADSAFVPFGGRGASGNGGRYGAEYNLNEFTQWQWVTTRSDASGALAP